MAYTYLIIDDEPLAHDLIITFAQMAPQLEKAGQCYSAMEAIQFLASKKVDLLFLDLNMPKIKGFEFLRTLSDPPKVIVTTAYQEFALEGFELDVVDYLLKPFSLERFLKAVNKATTPSDTPPTDIPPSEKKESMFIKEDKKIIQVFPAEIDYVEAYGNYSKLYLNNKIILSHEKISSLEKALGDAFVRIHKSYLISFSKIESISGNRVFISGTEIPIGQTYKNALYNRVGR